MAQSVAGELYELYYDLDGQLAEIKRQMRQPTGYPFDPQILKIHLQEAIEGRFGREAVFKYDKRKDGWKLVEEVEFNPIAPAALELVSFIKERESFVGGEEMLRRARVELRANFGQRQAEYLLEHQQEIPEEFRKYRIVFTKTIWRSPYGDHRVPYLWFGGQWILDFRWLGDRCDSVDRLPRPRE